MGERCVEGSTGGARLIFCPSGQVGGPWEYDRDNKQLLHTTSHRSTPALTTSLQSFIIVRCLSARGDKPILEKCDGSFIQQKWVFIESKPNWA